MIDLHCHTKASDGSFDVHNLLQLARVYGITHLAITDHDTTVAVEKAVEMGNYYGVTVIPGIEISAYDYKRKQRAHIIGYYVKKEHPALEKICNPILNQRNESARKAFEIITREGYKIEWNDVCEYSGFSNNIYKQHIMHALMSSGHTKGIYSNLYKKLFSRGEDESPEGIAYFPIQYINVIEAVKAVREAGGVPVLAHPGEFDNYYLVSELIDYGLEGIEVKHPAHNLLLENKARDLALMHDLIMTGGSDFHGFYDRYPKKLGYYSPSIDIIYKLKEKSSDIR